MRIRKKIVGFLLVLCMALVTCPVQAAPANKSISVLCVGNSITQHQMIPDFWWGDWGMAASTVNTDYAHLLKYYLSNKYQNVSVTTTGLGSWEADVGGRANYLFLLDQYLAKQPNVVVVELGENCSVAGNFVFDYLYLINYIKWKSPGSKVILVGTSLTYWCDPNIEYYKQYVYHICKYAGYDIAYVDTSAICNNPLYEAHIGDLVAGWDFQWHAINNYAVAIHPSDVGMDYIARGIYSKI